MTAVLVIVGGVCLACGCWLAMTGLRPSAPPLDRLVAHLHRHDEPTLPGDGVERAGRRLRQLLGSDRTVSDDVMRRLRLVDRPLDLHVAYLAVGAGAGFVVPLVLVAAAAAVGVLRVPLAASLLVCIGAAALGVLIVHTDLTGRAAVIEGDLRHQLSAYLNVLTMLLAANHGHEGALKLAAEAGDGRLFVELRRRITESTTAGRPTTTALAALGRDLGVVELVEIAASASLATSQGAPVARSLAAKTETLRASLQADAETDARLRTSKITFPLVAMGLVFMVIGLYPALSSIQQGN